MGKDQLYSLVVMTVCSLLLITPCCYYIWLFWKSHNKFGVSARQPILIVCTTTMTVVWMLTRVVHQWLLFYNKFGFSKSTSQNVVYAFFLIIRWVAVLTGSFGLCIRIWLIFFDVNLAVANDDMRWISLITAGLDWYSPLRGVGRAKSGSLRGKLGSNANILRGVGNYSVHHSSHSYSTRSVVSTIDTHVKDKDDDSDYSGSGGVDKEKSGECCSDALDNWFYRNKMSYGNKRWLAARAFILMTMVLPLIIVMISVLRKWLPLLSLVQCVAMCGFFFYIWWRYPKYKDSLRLYQELRALALFTVFLAIMTLCFTVFYVWKTNFVGRYWRNYALNCAMIAAAAVYVVIQTQWVLYKFDIDRKAVACSQWMQRKCTCLGRMSLFTRIDAVMNRQAQRDVVMIEARRKRGESVVKDETKLELEDLLASKRGFRGFMAYLFTEFAYENLLCLVEIMQLRQCIVYEARMEALKQARLKRVAEAKELKEKCKEKETTESKEAIEEVKKEDDTDTAHKLPKSRNSSAAGFMARASPALQAIAGSVPGLTLFSRVYTSSQKGADALMLPPTAVSEDNRWHVELPESVMKVKSSISWNGDLTKEEKFLVLCEKYVYSSAELQVNLSARCRRKMEQKCSDLIASFTMFDDDMETRINIGMDVFNPVVREIKGLLKDTMCRFVSTREFRAIEDDWQQIGTRISLAPLLDEASAKSKTPSDKTKTPSA